MTGPNEQLTVGKDPLLAAIWIDNDGCPAVVRELVLRTAERRKLTVTVVGNSFVRLPPQLNLHMLVVPGSFDAADDAIVERCAAGDLVIASDIPLASRILAKGGICLSHSGELFDPQTIAERLTMRNLMHELRSAGTVTGGPAPFNQDTKKKFADALDRITAKMRPSR